MILTAVGMFLIIMGVLVFYAHRNPDMKERKDGSFNPLGYSCLDVAFVYFFAAILIIAGVVIIILLP